jgi:FKBP-type peptidyl-prolyl cis-trans isomerase
MQRVPESSVMPNKQGPGIILIRKKRQHAPKDGSTNNIPVSRNVLPPDGPGMETTGAVPSTSLDGFIILQCPKPGDVCTIQYRCFILESTQNGQHQQPRRFVDVTNWVGDPAQVLTNSLLQDNIPRHATLEFEIGKGTVIRGLEVAVQHMLPLEDTVYEVILPHWYAYGHRGHMPEIPPKTDLLFEIKLQKIHYKNSKRQRCGWFEGMREMIGRLWSSAS